MSSSVLKDPEGTRVLSVCPGVGPPLETNRECCLNSPREKAVSLDGSLEQRKGLKENMHVTREP